MKVEKKESILYELLGLFVKEEVSDLRIDDVRDIYGLDTCESMRVLTQLYDLINEHDLFLVYMNQLSKALFVVHNLDRNRVARFLDMHKTQVSINKIKQYEK